MSVSLDKLTTVTKNFTKNGQTCDIRYSQTQEKFYVNDEIFTRLNLNDRGFMLHYDAEEGKMYLSIHPNEDAVMFTGSPKSETKSKAFQSSEFQKYLTIFDWLPENEETDLELDLTPVETDADFPLYELNVVGGQQTSTHQTQDLGTQDTEVENTDPVHTADTESPVAADNEDPFGS